MADLEALDEDAPMKDKEEDDGDDIIDLTDQNLTSIEQDENLFPSVKTLILDNNAITKLDGLEKCKELCQLSLINNAIVRMHGLQDLSNLTVLSLSNNSVTCIEHIKELNNLAWLDLSSNSIKVIENLPVNGKLYYLDLSDNDINVISNLNKHVFLKTLLLHGNKISTLKSASTHLPESLAVLSLADNEIYDLNEVCYLSGLQNLQQLSISSNPSVIMTAAYQGFDYRSFVWNWCPSLVVLDGFIISEKERLLGEWLYSQGKGRHFSPGEHSQLVEYLAATCPLTSSEQLRTEEDSKLSQILSQQRRYQQQLQHQHDHYHFHPNNHHQFSSSASSGVTTSPRLRETSRSGATEANTLEREPSASFSQSVDTSTEYSTQPTTDTLRSRQAWAAATNWHGSDSRRQQSHIGENLSLQDISHDDDKSSESLLDSDSVYLPFNIPASPIVLRRPFTAPEKSQTTLKSPPSGKLQSPRDRPATAAESRTSSKYEALEQRPIKPFNQNLSSKSTFKPNFEISLPVSSNSEPTLSQPSESQLPTACSQDYDSSSEQTTSESEPVVKNKSQTNPEHPHLARVEELGQNSPSSQSPPKDKLNLIKSVAGNKKAERGTFTTALTDKAKAATKLRSATVTSMKIPSQNNSNTSSANVAAAASTTASTMAASALMRTRLPKSTSHIPQGDGSSVRALEHVDESVPDRKESGGHYRSSRVNNADSKQMKSRLNMERMESKKDTGSFGNVRDSGFLSRPSSDAVLEDSQAGLDNKAATAIQAFWRGYWAREHNSKVVSVRKEIRARRAEDHIMLLRKDLERNQKLYEEEKRLRILQMEAIKLLYQEVQALKSQRHSSSRDQIVTDGHYPMSGHVTPNMSPTATALSGTSTGCSEMNRTQDLEQTCIGLQTQVTQLQEALESVSSAVFRTNSLDGTSFDLTDHSQDVQVLPYSDNHSDNPHGLVESSHWSSIPHSLSPFPSEEEEVYYRRVPFLGAPSPPRRLQILHLSHNSVLLSWQPSTCSMGSDYEEEGNMHIIGYRVFVSDQLKAFICQKTSALVKGLNPTTTYKFYVKALSGFGESYESNIIMAKLAKGQERHHFSETSDSANSDNSEKDDDTIENMEKQRRKSRKLRKSPRSVEKRRISSKIPTQQAEFMEGVQNETGQNENNNNATQDVARIFTQPKMHTHRRNRSRELHNQGEGILTETTSKESSPAAGMASADAWQGKAKGIPHSQHSSKLTSSSSPSYREGSRKLPESPSAGGSNIERTTSHDGKERSNLKESYERSPSQDETVRGVSSIFTRDTSGSKKESPSSGSSRRESPTNKRDSPGSGSTGHSNISPSCGSEGEQRSKISPKPGKATSSPTCGSLDTNQSMSSTFTIDKANSFLESVNAITETALGSRSYGKGSSHDRILHSPGAGSRGHRRVRSRDYQLRSEKSKSTPELASVDGGRKSGSDGERDVLSMQEALKLNIGKSPHQVREESKEGKNNDGDNNSDLASRMQGHRRKRSKDLNSKIDEWKKGDVSSEAQQGEERKEDLKSDELSKAHQNQCEEDGTPSSLPPTKDGRPVLDGRRRHSSGSGPSSPIIMTGEKQGGEEKTRMSVAEMIEQRAKSLKSSSLNSLTGRSSEDSGSRQDINKRTPSSESLPASSYKGDTSKRTISNESLLSGGSSKGDGSKRTHSSDSLISIRTDTSKRSHSNESLPGSARTDNSRRSPSNESLPESIREERESDLSPSSSQASIPSQTSNSQQTHHHFRVRSHSSESSKETGQAVASKDTSTATTKSRETTNSVVSKLLLKLESITRNNSTSVKETKESLINRKLAAEGNDGSGPRPPSDDERRSGRRSRTLSESDGENCTSDAGSQLPPKAPSESSSGSHSDDNRHSRRRHQRTPSDHKPATSVTHQDSDPRRPAHSPIIMEGGRMPKSGSSNVRRNQSFHGLLPSKHQDTKTNPSSTEEISPSKPEEQIINQVQPPSTETPSSRPRSHLRSRTPSPARTRQPVLSAAHLSKRTSDPSNN